LTSILAFWTAHFCVHTCNLRNKKNKSVPKYCILLFVLIIWCFFCIDDSLLFVLIIWCFFCIDDSLLFVLIIWCFFCIDDSLLYSDELKPRYFEALEEKDKVVNCLPCDESRWRWNIGIAYQAVSMMLIMSRLDQFLHTLGSPHLLHTDYGGVGHRVCDRMVVGFTTTCAYYH
jgi:hypothetical protein